MTQHAPVDLRLPALAAVAWGSALTARLLPVAVQITLAVLLVSALAAARSTRRLAAGVAALWMAVSGGVGLRNALVHESWVATMAREHAIAHLVVEIRADPKVSPGREEDRATVRARVQSLDARGKRSQASVAVVLVLPAPQAKNFAVGEVYDLHARLSPSAYADEAALALVQDTPQRIRGPTWIDRSAGTVRDAIQRASAGHTQAGGLVPALVDGDERGLPAGLSDEFQTAGLLHLLAVSGTNFVLLGAAWLAFVRRLGVRGRAMIPFGLLGIVALVVLARAEPSVVRAAVMGGVGLIGLGQGRRNQGLRLLSACVVGVMVFDPGLATSAGFALSALATAGILLLAPRWRDAMAEWMPMLVAEAIAVTMAAYVACLPLVVALSGRVSLVALPANLLAGVVVGPATVLGFVGGVIGLVSTTLGSIVATPATWCASWIAHVAHVAAGLPHPDMAWGRTLLPLVLLGVLSVIAALGMRWVLRRPRWALPLLSLFLVAGVVGLPVGSWPPQGWVMVACDVGQGDGLVIRLADHRGLVIDTGPDPAAMRRCLRDLHITTVPEVVLTHFHSDHVNGLGAVVALAKVGRIEVTDFDEPASRVAYVQQVATAANIAIQRAERGQMYADGEAQWQILAPLAAPPTDSDSPPNDASIVILLQIRGIRILLMGDEETGSQELLAQTYPQLRADVLKVAHHGSAKQDVDLVMSLGARDAIISAGRGNSYGLPKASTLELLRRAGMRVHRTDVDGAQAVVVNDHGDIRVVARG